MTGLILVGSMLFSISVVSVLLIARSDAEFYHRRFFLNCIFGGGLGFFIGVLANGIENTEIILSFVIAGLLSTALITLLYLSAKKAWLKEEPINYYDDGTPPKFYITGDKHGAFGKVKKFCRDMGTRKNDVLIILGDTGFNYYGDERDDKLKQELSEQNITLFCLHGNKENRPENVGTYGIRNFCGGKVYYEPRYPNIYFAIDGETYTFEGKRYMAVGGAHSVDKMRCLDKGLPFFEDEMPSDAVKAAVEQELESMGNSIYGMLTHTCPLKYLPVEMFMSTRQSAEIRRKPRKAKHKKLFKPDIDRSTEEWLDSLEEKLDYNVWFCGHYHIDKQIDKINMMFHDIRPLHIVSSSDER